MSPATALIALASALTPLAAAQAQPALAWAAAGTTCQRPALLGDFSAESTISDRGRLLIWSYHASLAVHTTPYFGTGPTLIVSAQDPGATWLSYLSMTTGEVVVDHPQHPGDATVHVLPNDPAYGETLTTLSDTLAQMIKLDHRNAALGEAVAYLAGLRSCEAG